MAVSSVKSGTNRKHRPYKDLTACLAFHSSKQYHNLELPVMSQKKTLLCPSCFPQGIMIIKAIIHSCERSESQSADPVTLTNNSCKKKKTRKKCKTQITAGITPAWINVVCATADRPGHSLHTALRHSVGTLCQPPHFHGNWRGGRAALKRSPMTKHDGLWCFHPFSGSPKETTLADGGDIDSCARHFNYLCQTGVWWVWWGWRLWGAFIKQSVSWVLVGVKKAGEDTEETILSGVQTCS